MSLFFVKLDNIDIDETLIDVERLLKEDKQLSPALRSVITVLVMVVKLLSNRVGLNSHNSSKPPSTDNNKKKPKDPNQTGKKSGGQKGRAGVTLKQTEAPDAVTSISIDRRSLPRGEYEEGGFEKRQVFDIDISRWITEYQAQVLIHKETGKRYVASFPKGVNKAVQYGDKLKSHAVYMSQYQLLPYKRVQEFFTGQMGIPLSEGSIYNFNLVPRHINYDHLSC